MIYVAKIEDNKVIHVFVESDEYEPDTNCVIVGEKNTVGIGYQYENKEFTPPQVVDEPEETT